MHISFITTIKICPGYEWLLDRINIYILNIQHYCKKYDIPYEILICEQIDNKNVFLCKDRLAPHNPTTLKWIEMEQKYPNPHGFNLIESYGKNRCLSEATGTYTCMTSADQILSEELFLFIKLFLQLKTFYRFATYEIEEIQLSNYNIEPLVDLCKMSKKRLCNSGCFESRITPQKLAQKSGDIMLLDTQSFKDIKGWPENDCFTHVDWSVCIVCSNNFPHFVPDKAICTYTMEQANRKASTTSNELEQYQQKICQSYSDKKQCN